MKSKKFCSRLFRIANLRYKKILKQICKNEETPMKQIPCLSQQYSHRIYANISDCYINTPQKTILRSLEKDYATEEIRKIQKLINSLSLKGCVTKTTQKEKFDFDNIQNYVIPPDCTAKQ